MLYILRNYQRKCDYIDALKERVLDLQARLGELMPLRGMKARHASLKQEAGRLKTEANILKMKYESMKQKKERYKFACLFYERVLRENGIRVSRPELTKTNTLQP